MQQNNVGYGLAGQEDVLAQTHVAISVVNVLLIAVAALAKWKF